MNISFTSYILDHDFIPYQGKTSSLVRKIEIDVTRDFIQKKRHHPVSLYRPLTDMKRRLTRYRSEVATDCYWRKQFLDVIFWNLHSIYYDYSKKKGTRRWKRQKVKLNTYLCPTRHWESSQISCHISNSLKPQKNQIQRDKIIRIIIMRITNSNVKWIKTISHVPTDKSFSTKKEDHTSLGTRHFRVHALSPYFEFARQQLHLDRSKWFQKPLRKQIQQK